MSRKSSSCCASSRVHLIRHIFNLLLLPAQPAILQSSGPCSVLPEGRTASTGNAFPMKYTNLNCQNTTYIVILRAILYVIEKKQRAGKGVSKELEANTLTG